jgi:Fe-S-cluster containining protein
MTRAERRRLEKESRKRTGLKESTLSASRVDVATIKRQLQQQPSPAHVQQVIAALVAQGFPAEAGEELAVYAAEYHDATALLREARTAENVAALVANAHDWAETMISQSPEQERRACKAGCAFCCYLPTVLVTAAEAVYLADWLCTHCSPEELQAIRQRLAERRQQMAAPSSTVSRNPLPCALLQDNRCLAYEARPLKCRGWNSIRRDACEQAYGHGEATTPVPFDTYAFVMGNAVLNGLSDSTARAGLDGTTYDLSDALTRALQIPDSVQRWRNGEKLLAQPWKKGGGEVLG